MTAKSIVYLAAALALVGSLATCTPAKAQTNLLAEYIATLPPDMQRDAFAIRASLKRPVVTFTTNTLARARTANERALVQAVVPFLATREELKQAPDKEALLDERLAAKLAGGTLAETRRCVLIQSIRLAVLREGNGIPGEEADEPRQRVTREEGPPRWQAIGLLELPTVQAIAEAVR